MSYTLTEDEHHLWIVNVNVYKQLIKNYKPNEVLLKNEQEKSKRFMNKFSKSNYILGKILTRILLTKYDQTKLPSEWIFERNEYNKPLLINSFIHVNISHSNQYIAVLFSRFPCGVDIEDSSVELGYPVFNRVQRFLHPYEYKMINESENQKSSFLSIWTRKEAYVKALGYGMYKDFNTFSVVSKVGKEEIVDRVQVSGGYFSFSYERYTCSVFILNQNQKEHAKVRIFDIEV